MPPRTDPPGSCGRCDAAVLTLHGPRGALVVDAIPDPHRGTVLSMGLGAAVLAPGTAAGARKCGVELFALHSVTCPFGRGR